MRSDTRITLRGLIASAVFLVALLVAGKAHAQVMVAQPVMKNLPIVCVKLDTEGKFVGECNAGATAATGSNEYYAPVLPDTLVRWCAPSGCSWSDRTGFRYVKYRDVPPGGLVDTCQDTIPVWSRDPFPWTSATCANYKGIPKEQVAQQVLVTGGAANSAQMTWARAKQTDDTPITEAHAYRIWRRRSNAVPPIGTNMEIAYSAIPAQANGPATFAQTIPNQSGIRCFSIQTIVGEISSPLSSEICKQFRPGAPSNGSITAPTNGSIIQ